MRRRFLQFKRVGFSIRTQLLLIVVCLAIGPFLWSGAIWYRKATMEIQNSAIQFSNQVIDLMNTQLEHYFRGLEQHTYPLLTHPLVQQFGRLEPDEQYERIALTKKIQEELLPSVLFSRPDIENIFIYSTKGLATSNSGGYSNLRYSNSFLYEIEGEERFTIKGLNVAHVPPVLSVVRSFYDTNTYQAAGVIVLDINMSELQRMMESAKMSTKGTLWIMDTENRYVYHPDRSLWGKPVPTSSLQLLSGAETGSIVRPVEGSPSLIHYQRANLSNWTIVSVVPLKPSMAHLIKLRNLSLGLAAVLLFITLSVVGGFALHLTRSLLRIQRLMIRAEQGDLLVRATQHNNNEIGSLSRSFNRMVSRIQQLLEEVRTAKSKETEMQLRHRDSQLLAMQSQINPHFLYNTLEIINAMAKLDDNWRISRTTVALAGMLRYNLGQSNQVVSLQDEIEHIQMYLTIQKERFNDMVMEIELDQAFEREVSVIRLTLQPLIENAFIHGYERSKKKPNYLGVWGVAEEHTFKLYIADRGRGMNDATLQQLNARLCSSEAIEETGVNEPTSGIGLWNVHCRLRFTFGSPYGIVIRSSDENGTTVELTLPYKSIRAAASE